jgi:hypothetical protein
MADNIYTAQNDTLQVAVHRYPVDGVQVTVSIWNGNDFVTKFDKRVIADSLWEAMGSAMTQGLDIEWEQADYQLAEWGIFPPEDDDEN